MALAAVGAGEYRSITQACAATVSTATETKPNAKARKAYDQKVETYRELYRLLKPAYERIAAE